MFTEYGAVGFSVWFVLTFCGGEVVSTYCVPRSSPYDANNLDTYPLDIQNPPVYQPATAALVDTSVQAVRNYIVDKHNCLRTLHPAPQAANMLEVQWNDEVALGAQQHADNCVFAHNTAENRSTSQWSMCGQNLFQGSTFYPWRYAIDDWFDEVYACTDGTASSCNTGAVVGHYTQVVWAKSWQIGCAVKNCGANVLYVCNYCPLGNYNQPPELTYQTGSPCSSCPLNCKEGKLCTNHCNYFDKYTSCPSLMSAANACTSSMYKDDCAATCKCGRNDGLTNFPDTTTAAPMSTPSPTTAAPTIPAPTTPVPTTPPVTTPAPTTPPVTTPAPTTPPLTTAVPTTPPVTTPAPTTPPLTTAVPTTPPVTTPAPTTPPLTTAVPTTPPVTTPAPTTPPLTTAVPTTPPVTTPAPTTPPMTTAAPTTAPVATPAPTTPAATTPPVTTPTAATPAPTTPASATSAATVTTAAPVTSAPCLSATPVSASTPPPGSGRPSCYSRCDTTFCADKGTGLTYNEVSPCSRNYCKCNNGVGTYLSCSTGKYFDGSVPLGSQSCHAGNATWCPPSGGLSGPAPLTLAQVAPLCNAANCAARNGQNIYYALDCCSRYWCYCYPNGTQSIQTCPTGTYFDHRSEWAQCRSSNQLEFCPTTFTTTTVAAPAGCATTAPVATSSVPVTTTTTPTTTQPLPSTTPPATTTTVPPTTPPATTSVAPTTTPPVTSTAPPTTTTKTLTTTPQPISTSPTSAPNMRPQCYSRCDTTFCSGKPTKYYATNPCSRNLCYCNNGAPTMYGCSSTGLYFDEASQTCMTPSSSFCPSAGNSSAPAPQPLSAVQGMCNAQNCADRLDSNAFYPLECCSPYWCYCYANGTIATQACPAGQYFDHRSEWVQCRPISNFEFCAH